MKNPTPTIREEIQRRVTYRQISGSYENCPHIYRLPGFEMVIRLNRRSRPRNPSKPSVPTTPESKGSAMTNPQKVSGALGPADGKETSCKVLSEQGKAVWTKALSPHRIANPWAHPTVPAAWGGRA